MPVNEDEDKAASLTEDQNAPADAPQEDAEVETSKEHPSQDAGFPSDLEQDAPPEEQPEDQGRKQKQSAEERIAQLTAEKHRFKKQRDELRHKLELYESDDDDQNEGFDEDLYIPTDQPQQHLTADQIAEATQRAIARQRRDEIAREQAQVAQQERAVESGIFLERFNQFKQTTADADIALSVDLGQGADPLYRKIQSSEVGPQIAYKLAKDPAARQRLATLPIDQAFYELGKIEASLEAQPTRKATTAPPPVETLSGANNVTQINLEDMPWNEYRKARGLD